MYAQVSAHTLNHESACAHSVSAHTCTCWLYMHKCSQGSTHMDAWVSVQGMNTWVSTPAQGHTAGHTHEEPGSICPEAWQ